MAPSYPVLDTDRERILTVAVGEEAAFAKTLSAGSALFAEAAAETKAAGSSQISGDAAFTLHDTYGFPIDLTLEMAAEAGLAVDQAEFRRLMTEQKERAKADARAKKGGTATTEAYRTLRSAGETPFRGFTDLAVETPVRGIVKDGELVASARPGDVVEVVLEETPFYAEAGGQDADAGTLSGDGMALDVLDVQRPVQGLVVHKALVTEGELGAGARVLALVDGAARFGACQAHTATHLMNAALRQLLGQGTHQAGSYNKPGYLRFDFNAAQALSPAMRSERSRSGARSPASSIDAWWGRR